MHAERTKEMRKKIKCADCSMRNADESQEHAMLYDKHEQTRCEWIKSLKIKFNDITKKKNTTECEKKIIDEIGKDVEKYFNKEGNLHTTQQVLGMREVFRGLAVKEWIETPNEIIDCSQCNKVLIA